jgi:RNA-directed DNA polymerase
MQLSLFKHFNKEAFWEELFQAYFDCRKNKRNTLNALVFEKHLEHNLFLLSEEILNGKYIPGRSIAFIVNRPVKREVFAADFRDRVVHHWLINKLNPLFEELFIDDSYACRLGKGTHFGQKRIIQFVQQCSNGYAKNCYILKLDILGFFMHINRSLLLNKLNVFINLKYHDDDKELVLEIAQKIILNSPEKNCIIKGSENDWLGLPPNKSLFHSPQDCGLPIGNLTSQVLANFYLHPLDELLYNRLGFNFYGRYVDDFVVVHDDISQLKSLIKIVNAFLQENLGLKLHPNKIHLQHFSKGVRFLGVIIKPNRTYIAPRTKGNFFDAILKYNVLLKQGPVGNDILTGFLSSMNSYLGILKHTNSYRLRRKMIKQYLDEFWFKFFRLDSSVLKFKRKAQLGIHKIIQDRFFIVL